MCVFLSQTFPSIHWTCGSILMEDVEKLYNSKSQRLSNFDFRVFISSSFYTSHLSSITIQSTIATWHQKYPKLNEIHHKVPLVTVCHQLIKNFIFNQESNISTSLRKWQFYQCPMSKTHTKSLFPIYILQR